jgi:hypothetical protein
MCVNVSCETPVSVPIADVDFTTNITANDLVHVGGHAYFKAAIQGMVVYRLDITTFYAYDRACSYDYKEGGYVSVSDDNPFQLVCGTCRSTYNILNGYPTGNGKATAPLRKYKAVLLDDINLRVYK